MRRRGLGWVAAWFALASLGYAGVARAEQLSELSDYERESVEVALERLGGGAQLDPTPEGKWIERVDVVALEVFEPRDPFPRFLNVFHSVSRDDVVRDILTLRVGQRFTTADAAESSRLLRGRVQLSVALIVAVRGSSPDRVRLVVVTKDVWSLRLNSQAEVVDGQVTDLLLQPAETNLLGTHTVVGALYTQQPDALSLGTSFWIQSLAGSRMQASADANLIISRSTGAVEGSFGNAAYGLPIYSLANRWSWWLALSWRQDIQRLYSGMRLRWYDARPEGTDTPCSETEPRCIPFSYPAQRYSGSYELRRSWGTQHKFEIAGGAEATRRAYGTPELPNRDPQAMAQFVERQLPVSDQRVGPFVTLQAYEGRFAQVLDYETLALQEDLRLGYTASVKVYPASTAVGSSRDLLGTRTALRYLWLPAGGVVHVAAATTSEWSTPGHSQVIVEGGARSVTPQLAFGRLLVDGAFAAAPDNYLNHQFRLGGSARLRGYLPGEFVGKDLLAASLEWRTPPLAVLSTRVGAAAFYDVGDAVDGLSHLHLKRSAGVGLRWLFPQADRIVLRIDWGIPLVDPRTEARSDSPRGDVFSRWPGSVFATFGQAFSTPAILPTEDPLLNYAN